MEKRKLGSSGLMVSPIAFGGNVFGWTADEKTSFKLLDTFTEAEFNFIDTADVYSRWAEGNKGGESETIIGNWLKKNGKRDQVIIATKGGSDMGQGRIDVSKKYLVQAAENSLKRLQTDYIDLYFTHFDNPDFPVEEALEAYQQLIKEGKVRSIGTSNMEPARLLESLKVAAEQKLPSYQVLQPLYNLVERKDYEEKYKQLVLNHDMGVMTYYSLASGFLTGKYRNENDLSKSSRGRGVKKYLNEKGSQIISALDEVAEAHNSSPAAVALAWLIAQPSISAAIASATNEKQLDTLISAPQLRLTENELNKLSQSSN